MRFVLHSDSIAPYSAVRSRFEICKRKGEKEKKSGKLSNEKTCEKSVKQRWNDVMKKYTQQERNEKEKE